MQNRLIMDLSNIRGIICMQLNFNRHLLGPALIFIENHFEMFQRCTVFLILDQPEKNTWISVSL